MKKIFTLLFSVFSLSAFAQQEENWCGFDEHNAALEAQYPGSKESIHEQIMRFRNEYEATAIDRVTIGIVPVVVHVIHDGGSSNISYDQIESAILQLNEDYQMLNADAGSTRNTADAPFAPIASDMEIEFKLAKIDPNGDCTNGVQRRDNSAGAYNAGDNVKTWNGGGFDGWPRDSYLNIWVVESIESSGGGVTLGYAQFPYFGAANTYGVVIRNDAFGSSGTANGDRTLTHELGHCFGLFHTFQDGCHSDDCGDNADYCCDTPPVFEPQWSCNNSQNTCTQIPTNDTYGIDAFDQFENYMSYSPCQYMFSEDQKAIVHGNFSGIAWMQDLISPANATATGVNQLDVLCKAEFTSSNTLICAGSSVDFTDISYFNVSGRTWTFAGGSPGTSTDANPNIVYNTPGVYNVSLEVTDGAGTETITETEYIVVLESPGVSPPYTEGFEDYTTLPDSENWIIVNEVSGTTWDIQTGIGSSGDQCIMLDNHGVTNGSKDELISGALDLSGVDISDNIVFNFKYAYRKRSASNDEWLRFFVSNDCGETWVLRKNIHGDDLSELVQGGSFDSPLAEDWAQVDITNIGSAYFTENFRFKFQFENDNGNNIYLDDINLYPSTMTAIEDLDLGFNVDVYPNPTQGQFNVKLNTVLEGAYQITLTNAVGQKVLNVFNGQMSQGTQKIAIEAVSLSTGVYFLNIEHDGAIKTLKLIKD
jgi:PKD repeat protein